MQLSFTLNCPSVATRAKSTPRSVFLASPSEVHV